MKNSNRIIRINKNGTLFIQYGKEFRKELEKLREKMISKPALKVTYIEKLSARKYVTGTILKVTKSGVSLTNWRID